MTGSQHEVLIVRYGTRTTTRSDVFLNYHAYGEPDGPHARHALFRHAVEEPELQALADVIGEGRAVLFEDHYEVTPGIQVLRVGGHTPGKMAVIGRQA